MLMQEPTKDMVEEWIAIYHEYKNQLKPNKKTGLEIVSYLKHHYEVKEIENQEWMKLVHDQIVLSDNNKVKLNGKDPVIALFEVTDKNLYNTQDDCFKGTTIWVGIELHSAYFYVEGSSFLYDDLIAYTGLDVDDLKNYFLVAQYIQCQKKHHHLEERENV